MQDAFLRCGKIKASDFYVDDTLGGKGLHVRFKRAAVEAQVVSAQKLLAKARHYNPSDPSKFLVRLPGAFGKAMEAMRRFEHVIKDARVCVFGSQQPTYESAALALGAKSVTVFEFQVPEYDHPKVSSQDARQLLGLMSRAHGWGDQFTEEDGLAGRRLLAAENQFDVAISISSFDHDGLGRYGGGLCPDCDLRAMDAVAAILNPSGTLIVSVPVGPDEVAFNLHRRYGRVRLPLFLDGWMPVDRVAWEDERLDAKVSIRHSYEPVFVLRLPQAGEEPFDWHAEFGKVSKRDEL
jgi:SAM-dependent methyltransferase